MEVPSISFDSPQLQQSYDLKKEETVFDKFQNTSISEETSRNFKTVSPAPSSLVSNHQWFSSNKATANANNVTRSPLYNNNGQFSSLQTGSIVQPDNANFKNYYQSEDKMTSNSVVEDGSKSTIRRLQELSPMYDYKEGVLFQTNYKWNGGVENSAGSSNIFPPSHTIQPNSQTLDFKDSNDYVVKQRYDADRGNTYRTNSPISSGGRGGVGAINVSSGTAGFQESHGKMERETGDKRGTISRETWTTLGKDKVIREENLKFQHRGPISELSRALPPDNKGKILSTLYGDDQAKRILEEEEIRVIKPASIFPRNLGDTFRNEIFGTTSAAAEDSSSSVGGGLQTTRENIFEQSYCDEYVTESGFKPSCLPPPLPKLNESSNNFKEKYYRRKVEDEDLIYKGPPSLAASTLNSFEEYLAKEKSREKYTTESSSYTKRDAAADALTDFTTRHGGATTTRTVMDSRDMAATTSAQALNSSNLIKEESMKRYKMIEDDLYQSSANTSDKTKLVQREEYSSGGRTNTISPRTKNTSVQYDLPASYRVVFEKLTRKERITERENLDRENATTQTYVPYVPQPTPPIIKEISISTPSLIEPPIPYLPPTVMHDECDEKYHELSKSLGDIALGIKELNEKMDKKPEPIIIEPTKHIKPSFIPCYEDMEKYLPDQVKYESIDYYHKGESKTPVKIIDKPKTQKRVLKTRKSKKVRMEETDVVDDYNAPEYEKEGGDQYFYGESHPDTYAIVPERASRDRALDKIDRKRSESVRLVDERRYGDTRSTSSIPLPAATEEVEEPEIVEFYKKTHTHKVKKVTIKSTDNGIEKVITENVYDPPVITTKYESRIGGGGDAAGDINIEKEYVKHTLTSNNDAPLNQDRWIEQRYESNRMPPPNQRSRYDRTFDADSGIATSIPPNTSSLPRRSQSKDVVVEEINFVPNRFRSSGQYSESEKFKYSDDPFRYKDGRGYPPTTYERRPDNYQKAWDDLSERQSIAEDYGTVGSRRTAPQQKQRSASTSLGAGGGGRLNMETVTRDQFRYSREKPLAVNERYYENYGDDGTFEQHPRYKNGEDRFTRDERVYRNGYGGGDTSIPITRSYPRQQNIESFGEYLVDEEGKKTFSRFTSTTKNQPPPHQSADNSWFADGGYNGQSRQSSGRGSYRREAMRYPKNYIPSEPKYPPIRAGI